MVTDYNIFFLLVFSMPCVSIESIKKTTNVAPPLVPECNSIYGMGLTGRPSPFSAARYSWAALGALRKCVKQESYDRTATAGEMVSRYG